MLSFNNEKINCTGCSACFSICPVKCIKMEQDEEGFLYPVSSDKCINCNMCEKVCPKINPIEPENHYRIKAFAAVSKNKETWQKSSSGGAFSEICKAFCQGEAYIAGAAWNDFDVSHILVKGVENISPLRKSKYIASDLGETFSKIKALLSEGNKVVFCGTPCQVSGLRSFLEKDYENLLLIDLICHGVGSPKVFKTCISQLQKDFGKEIESYEFRAKRETFEAEYLSKITFKDNKTEYIGEDRYIQLFLSQKCLRPSCGENCSYRKEIRQGDITIADFKGLLSVFPHLKGTKRNYSSIIINTKKGENVLDILSKNMELIPCEIDDIKKFNPLFYRQTKSYDGRNEFFELYCDFPEKTVNEKTLPSKVVKRSIKRKIFDKLPKILRKKLIDIWVPRS